jgi:NADP-dependent 3-hydroxy acid dehydrogenase YdfG
MTKNDSVQTALVTGASGGIGEAICRLLIKRRYRVVATARSRDKLEQLASELGNDLFPLALDVTDTKAVGELPKTLPQDFSNVDILVNNAGHDVGGRRRFDQGSAEQWNAIIETNVQGLIQVTHALVGGMLERGRGHIVNIGSTAGLQPTATMAAYVASKYAVHGLSDTLRLDYAGKGIRVTEIMPGMVKSGFAKERLGEDEAAEVFYDSFDALLQPQDIAETVCFAIAQPPHVEIAQLVVLPVTG